MTFKNLQGSGGIREHVDNFLLRNKGIVEYCAMKIKGGGEFNYSGKQGNMNHPPSLFLKALTFEALRYRSSLAESTHLM